MISKILFRLSLAWIIGLAAMICLFGMGGPSDNMWLVYLFSILRAVILSCLFSLAPQIIFVDPFERVGSDFLQIPFVLVITIAAFWMAYRQSSNRSKSLKKAAYFYFIAATLSSALLTIQRGRTDYSDQYLLTSRVSQLKVEDHISSDEIIKRFGPPMAQGVFKANDSNLPRQLRSIAEEKDKKEILILVYGESEKYKDEILNYLLFDSSDKIYFYTCRIYGQKSDGVHKSQFWPNQNRVSAPIWQRHLPIIRIK